MSSDDWSTGALEHLAFPGTSQAVLASSCSNESSRAEIFTIIMLREMAGNSRAIVAIMAQFSTLNGIMTDQKK